MKPEPMTYDDLKHALLTSPCTRFRLADAIRDFDKLDPVDAFGNAELLLRLQRLRCHELLPRETSHA